MSEWTVVTVIIALAGFVIAVISPVVKLNTALTRIKTSVSALEKDIDMLTNGNKQGHERIWEAEKIHEKQLVDLNLRLAVLERTLIK